LVEEDSVSPTTLVEHAARCRVCLAVLMSYTSPQQNWMPQKQENAYFSFCFG
jgi:hypothetical protein